MDETTADRARYTVSHVAETQTDHFFSSFEGARDFMANQLHEAFDADRLTRQSMSHDYGVWHVEVVSDVDGSVWRLLTGEDPSATPLTLQTLTERAREEGWVVAVTTNVHLDRADWPEGTGMVLVESFNEDGLPGYYQAGTDMEGKVCIGGDKLNDRPHADTVEGVLEWARWTWDSPDEPLPGGFGPDFT